jgi:superfamily II DNA or RNA helicase
VNRKQPRAGKRRSAKPSARPAPKLSRLQAPEDLDLRDWQIALRRQFGTAQAFRFSNLGEDPIFSEFLIENPASGGRYRVRIRGEQPGSNHCSCGDFATNRLGTCKHVEFLLERLRGKRGARRALREGCRLVHSELWLHYGARHSLRLRPGRELPASLHAEAEQLFEVDNGWRLPSSRFDRLPAFLAACAQQQHRLDFADDARRFLRHVQEAAQRRQRLEQRYPGGASDPGLRELVRAQLYPYQAEGVWFLARAGRALLADEMGLGKTVQAIAAAELWRREEAAERLLIVCPTSLKAQWAHELQRFAGRQAQIIEGNASERARLYAAPAPIKIASYDSLTRDIDLASAWRPDTLIVDEAQRVKNWDTRAARALKRLPSRFAVVITGTPLENKLEELLSIVQLVDREHLGPTWQFLHDHQLRDETGRVIGYRELDRIGQTLAPILLRRRKREVLQQLPQRSDQQLYVTLGPLQRKLHDENRDIVGGIVQRWRRTRHLSERDRRLLQSCLQNMRMACNSSYLLDRKSNEGSKLPELLAWLLPRLQGGDDKCVVFSAWIASHELLAAELARAGIGFVEFNGSVSARERARRVERFRDEPGCRVFLATDAGGVGLNLQQSASLIVNIDPPWNPAVLEQRIGRVYRLGQTRRVEVLNLIARDSIEEQMLGVLAFKRSLFEGTLDGGGSEVRLEGTRLARFMRTVQELTEPAPTDAPREPAQSEPEATATPQPAAPGASQQAAPSPSAPAPASGSAATLPAETPAATAAGAAATPAGLPLAALQPLLQAAGDWLTQLAQSANGQPLARVETDPHSGQPSLRLPLPPAQVLRRFADALEALQQANPSD